MSDKQKRNRAEKSAAGPLMTLMMRHELLSSCALTVAMGLAVGGVTTLLERLLA